MRHHPFSPCSGNDECGTGTNVICDSGDTGYPVFANGITYDPVADLTLVVASGAGISPTSNHGIHILGGDAINITLQDGSSIATTGNYASGVSIKDSTGSVSFLNEGTIRTGGNSSYGISVFNADDVSIHLSTESGIETNGDHSRGLRINLTEGDVSLLSQGTIETSGFRSFGIEVNSTYGSVDVTPSGAITTSGDQAHGIYLDFNYGPVSLNSSASITTSGDNASGIYVYAAYEESINITHTGDITTSGTDAHGIYVYGGDWPSNPPGAPVSITTSAGSTITITGSDADGISILSSGDSITDITLNLAGSIDVQRSGAAIRIRGSTPVTIDNIGTIRGAVITGDGDDSFTNAGFLYTDEVDMGGGYNKLVNSGTMVLSSSSGDIVGVDSFTNSGLIDLANGAVGDTLSISGDFVSAGGALYLDASLDPGTADLLTLDTVAITSNPTLIHVTGIGSGPTTAPILLVDADSDASNGSAFMLATRTIGAHEYVLAYDAAAAAWYLSLPSIFFGAAEYPALVSGALLAFASDLPSLHERLRDGLGDGKDRIEPAAWRGASQMLRPWIQLDTSRQDISGAAAYDLDVTKMEAGLDARASGAGGSLYSLGAFAGTGRGQQKFHGSSSQADADILTAGLYGAYRSGPFEAHGLLKYEHQALDYSSDAANDGLGLDLLGLSLGAAYRLERGMTYIEPRARLSYAHARDASFKDSSGARIDLDSADSLSGELAARLGWAGLHVDLALRHEFLGETSAEVSGLTFTDDLPGTVVRLASGFNRSFADGRFNLSLDAGYARGSGTEELSATAALHLAY